MIGIRQYLKNQRRFRVAIKFKLDLAKTNEKEKKANVNRGIEIGNKYAGELVIDFISLDKLELDPENKRKMSLTLEDARTGIKKDDPEYNIKKEDIKKLETLSKSIFEGQQINPIFVYRYGNKCRLISGERRTLASALAGMKNVIARIAAKKPSAVELRMLQWVENHEREDLTLAEKISSLELILAEHRKKTNAKLTASLLSKLTKMSMSQSRRYQLVLESNEEIKDAVKAGKLDNFRSIELICLTTNKENQKNLLAAALSGKTISEMLEIKKGFIVNKEENSKLKRRGRRKERVNLGSVKPNVVKAIVDALINPISLNEDIANKVREIGHAICWGDLYSVQKAFKKITYLIDAEGK
jgi:ParB family transcriptional regulator, chromosome partitioning protein